jgi:hypothetical protein
MYDKFGAVYEQQVEGVGNSVFISLVRDVTFPQPRPEIVGLSCDKPAFRGQAPCPHPQIYLSE